MPGRLLQSSPTRAQNPPAGFNAPGRPDIIDLALAQYDRLAARFRGRQHQGASLLKAGIEDPQCSVQQLIDELERVASRSKGPILLDGETGAGKSGSGCGPDLRALAGTLCGISVSSCQTSLSARRTEMSESRTT